MSICKSALFYVFILFIGKVNAQTCSVNAGVPFTLCVSADSFTLAGNATGALATTATWSLVSGPNMPMITDPASPATSVKGFVAGTYVFRYAATCSDSVVAEDSVTITVNAMPVFTAGRDSFVCGSNMAMRATLPAGATGAWIFIPSGSVSSINFSNPGSPVSPVNLTGYYASCPKTADAIWTVTQGACVSRDTARISFGAQSSSLPVIADQSICGTSFSGSYYYYGCGGNLAVSQLSGPSASSISYSSAPSPGSYRSFSVSDMIAGNYTFAIAAAKCDGTIYRDTFNLAVGSTVAVSNPSYSSKYVCQGQFDSVYYFEPNAALLPGETLTWNLISTFKNPSSLPHPVADTIGNVLRLRAVTHPDSTNTTAFSYNYSYTVSNGTCSKTYSVALYLYPPLAGKAFMPVLNLACGLTAANIVQPVTGTASAYNFARIRIASKPAGTPDPSTSATAGAINVSGLSPGKYVFGFQYYVYATDCEMKTASVEVNVSTPPGLANAGSNQVLPCGTDSSVLAGNVPPAGQTGTWKLVSGPSTVVLTNPHSASLTIKTLLPGTYIFRWEITYGASCPANSDEMEVVVTSAPPIVSSGMDRSVCYGYSIPLTGTPFSTGTTGRWRQISGPPVVIADSTASGTSISGTAASTVYAFTYTLSNVCGTGTDTVIITTGATQGPSDARITTADQCITSNPTTLNATAPTAGTGLWSQLSGPTAATIASPASNNTSVTGLSGGVYKFMWQVGLAGCDTLRDTISVAYRAGTLTANAGTDRYVCKDTIHLGAVTPAIGTGTWTQVAGSATTIENPGMAATAVSGLQPGGVYDYRWTVTLGTCPAASDDVHVVVSTPPSAARAMNDTTICGLTMSVGDQISLPINADTPTSGLGVWTILETPTGYNLPGIANAGAAHTSIPLIGGDYKLQWKVSDGVCPASYDTVTIDLVPKADAGNSSINLCEKVSYTFRGTNPGTGTVLWSQVSGPTTATITNPDNFATTIAGLSSGSYKFKYEVMHPRAGCSSFDTVIVNNAGRPIANAGRDSVFCWMPGSTTVYLKADTPASGSGSWSRVSGAGSLSYSPNASSNPVNALVNTPGLHQFSWTVISGACRSVDYKDVLVEQLKVPAIDFTPLTSCKDSFNVSVTSPYNDFKYAWSFPKARIKDTAGINLTGPISNNFLVSDTNNIYLAISNPATGCMARDSTAIIVNCTYLPLPLTLLSFDAYKREGAVWLQWNVATEKNISAYRIERSGNGNYWETLGTVVAKNNTPVTQHYNFTDSKPLNGRNLYRLSINEYDGSTSYSTVKMIEMGNSERKLLVYPNPAARQINLDWNNPAAAEYVLTDALGRKVLQGKLTGNSNNVIDISNMPAGFYLLQAVSEGTLIHACKVEVRH